MIFCIILLVLIFIYMAYTWGLMVGLKIAYIDEHGREEWDRGIRDLRSPLASLLNSMQYRPKKGRP